MADLMVVPRECYLVALLVRTKVNLKVVRMANMLVAYSVLTKVER